jgi:hypothetical protein
MKLTKKITFALGALAAAGAIHAQTAAASGTANGLLGQRYVEAGFGVQDIKHVSSNVYSLGAAVNVPFIPSLVDVGANYSYDWIKSAAFRGHANTFGGDVKVYTTLSGVKPFVSAGLGWQWSHAFGSSDDNGLWNAAVGVEIPVAGFTVTPRIVYHDDFQGSRDSSQDWTYEVAGNYWITRTAAAFASVGYADDRGTNFDSWNYRVGLRLKF